MPGHVLKHLHLVLLNLIVELLQHGCAEHCEPGTALAVLLTYLDLLSAGINPKVPQFSDDE